MRSTGLTTNFTCRIAFDSPTRFTTTYSQSLPLCHGVLARYFLTLECKEDDAPDCKKKIINGEEERRVFVARGTEISCDLCHDNKINEGGGDDHDDD